MNEAAFCTVFAYVGYGEYLAVEDQEDTAADQTRGEQSFCEILKGIGAFDAEGCHRTGEDDWNIARSRMAGEHVGDDSASFDHCVCPMRDDGRRAGDGLVKYSLRDQVTMLLCHVQRIDVHQLFHGDVGVWQAQERKASADLRDGVLHGAILLHVTLLNGAAGGYQVDSMHASHDSGGNAKGPAFARPFGCDVLLLLDQPVLLDQLGRVRAVCNGCRAGRSCGSREGRVSHL